MQKNTDVPLKDRVNGRKKHVGREMERQRRQHDSAGLGTLGEERFTMNYRKLFALLIFLLLLVLLWLYLAESDLLSFDYLRNHHKGLHDFIQAHYARAAVIFILLFISTALIVPGAIVLTIAGGALFGTLPAVLFVNIGSVIGAVITFVSTRYIFGESLQTRYLKRLERFNRELERHGAYYLITLRIIPILPAFIINCLGGLTRMRFFTFVWTTSAGVLPGSLVYAYAGSRLHDLRHPSDILTWPVVLALFLMGMFSLLPVFIRHGRRTRHVQR